jgi:hypothetical protein
MNKLRYWYHKQSRQARRAVVVAAVLGCLVAAGIVAYSLFAPGKVEVRYGTIVRDPVDGHVWEDKTVTVQVSASEAEKYGGVEYIDKMSPEHEEQVAEEQAQETQKIEEVASTEVIQPAKPMMTAEQLESMRNLQSSVDTVSQNIIDGMKILNGIAEAKSELITYRGRLAETPVAPEIEPLKRQLLGIFDNFIRATDLYVQAAVTGNLSLATQANAILAQTNVEVQEFLPKASELQQYLDDLLNIVRGIE